MVDSYEAALKYLGRKDEAIITRLDKHNKAILSIYKLCVIAEAWNKADNFIPDYDDSDQDKWYPWFYKQIKNAGFVYASSYSPSDAPAFLGTYLCFKTEERTKQFCTQFIELWNDLLLIK